MRHRCHRRGAAARARRRSPVELVRFRGPDRLRDPGAGGVSVAVAGWALRTPLGNDPGTFRDRLLAGERAFPSTPPADGPVVARIPGEPRSAELRRWQLLGRVERFAVDAAKEALGDRRCASERLAIFWATGGLRVRWEETRPAL